MTERSAPIDLRPNEVIAFIGSMNAMPMMYALELRNLGYNVVYFVDAVRKDALSRPESHFPQIRYPYPRWIAEHVLPTQLLLPLFPKLWAAFYRWKVRRMTGKDAQCFVLNGFFVALAPHLAHGANVIGLSHGSDLDVWANEDAADALAQSFKKQSVFRYLPRWLAQRLIRRIVKRQFEGFCNAQTVVYFPAGFSAPGDKVVGLLIQRGVRYVPRYDVSFEPLRGQPREFRATSQPLELFSGVRFLFKTFSSGNNAENKGNDQIIEGIARYFTVNQNIRVHFVEKGDDVEQAKDLCRRVGLEPVVVWHKEMPFRELLHLYRLADICFDQVGDHWIGAIGFYALWLGKPLIANPERAVRSGAWPADHPICSARTADEIFEWLKRLEDPALRQGLSERSKIFAEQHLHPLDALGRIFSLRRDAADTGAAEGSAAGYRA